MRWLRSYPKTAAARELRTLLGALSGIKTIKERDVFIDTYKSWLNKYKNFVKSLPVSNIAFKDLKRTMVLINNALPDMFHYLKERSVPSTTCGIVILKIPTIFDHYAHCDPHCLLVPLEITK